jgi:hypothetical protein
MHHGEIALLVEIINDYFIISGFNPVCEVIPSLDYSTGYRPRNGIILKCNLQNGYLEALIDSPDEDSNDVDFSYWLYTDINKENKQKLLGQAGWRNSIREILVLDESYNKRHQTTLKTSSDQTWLDS